MVKLYENEKPRVEIMKVYDLTPFALERLISNHKATGSLKAEDNRSAKVDELMQLRKEVKKLRMENDILKQAALIMGLK